MRTRSSFILACGTLGFAAACFSPAHADDGLPALAAQNYDGVAVVNGGASSDEAAAMRQLAPRYPLRIVITGRHGAYEVAQSLSVIHEGHRVAEIPNAGPWLLMDLPPGRYTLQARFEDGLTMARVVQVTHQGATLSWVVPRTFD